MARKKKKTGLWILLSFLAVFILFIFLWQFGTFDNAFSTIIPIESDTEQDIFHCQDDDFTPNSYCNVIGKMYCDEPGDTGAPIVVARAKDVNYGATNHWLALADQFNQLQGYCRMSSYSNTQNAPETGTPVSLPFGVTGYIWSGGTSSCLNTPCIYIVKDSNSYHRYNPSIACSPNLNPNPTSSGGQCGSNELCSGSSFPYSCSGFFEIKNLQGQPLINPVPLTCSGSSPCSKSHTYNGVPPDYVVTVTGGDRNEIIYTKYIVPECSQDTCEGNFIKQCVDGRFGDLIQCDYGCQNGMCIDPYDVEIIISDDRGFQRNSFSKNENINIFVNIITPSSLSGHVTLDIRKGSVQGTSEYTETLNFQANTPNLFEFTSQTTGVYYIVLSIDSQFGQEFYGIEPLSLNSFEIVDEFTANLRITQELGGVQNSNKFYTGYPLKIEYIFKEPGDTPILPDSSTVTYQIGTGSKISLTNPEISQDDFAGYYTYYLLPEQTGTYKFEATATRGSFTTNPSVKGPYPVEKDSIVITSHLSFNPVETGKFYSDILKFETRNRNKELIETVNTVRVKINGVESGTVPIKGSGGKYSIDYTFNTDNADYLFTIVSLPVQGDLVQGELGTELIKSGSEEDSSCKEDSECGVFGSCVSGGCETNIFLIISLVFGTGIVVVIIILIVRFARNRKRQPQFGGEVAGL